MTPAEEVIDFADRCGIALTPWQRTFIRGFFREEWMEQDKIRPPIPVRPEHGDTSTVEGGGPRPQEPEGWMREDVWRGARARGEYAAESAPEDPEIRAMRVCSAELEGLRESDDQFALSRALRYLDSRFGG